MEPGVNGGAAFWETTYRELGPEIHAFLARRVRRREDAEDLLQETFIRVIRSGTRLQEPSKVRGYLFRTAYRVLLNHIRKLGGSRPRETDLEALGEIPSADAGPDSGLAVRETAERLRRAVDQMPPVERRAFVLGVLEKRPYEEVARTLGWSREQVKVAIHRARKRALRELAESKA